MMLMLEGHAVAFSIAFYCGKKWFSVPHTSHSGTWIHFDRLCELLSSSGNPLTQSQIYRKLYSVIVSVLPLSPRQNSACICIDLTLSDFRSEPGDVANFPRYQSRNPLSLSLYSQNNKTLSFIPLAQSFSEQFTNFSANIRRKIRKAHANEVQIISGNTELFEDFYSIYRNNIHRLGSLGLPKKFLNSVVATYNYGSALIFLAIKNDQCLGSAILLTFGTFAENTWFASSPQGNKLYVTYALHNAMIQAAIEAHCTLYSFGRSTDGGPVHAFKKQWGTRDETIFLNSNTALPFDTGKHKLLNRIVRILPVFFSKSFDGIVARHIY